MSADGTSRAEAFRAGAFPPEASRAGSPGEQAPASAQAPPRISVVLPVHNEEGNLEELHREIVAALEPLGDSFEVLYIDDGSTDGSGGVLTGIHAGDPRVCVISFRRNFGQTAAMAAGFDHARGEIIVTLDSDRQNDPADIPRLLEKLAEGADVVTGWRRQRRDEVLRRQFPSRIANSLIRAITGVRVHDYGCMLKVFRGEIARELRLYGDMHRFIPAIAVDLGAEVVEIEVGHRPRLSGTSHYGLSRTLRVVLDLLTVKFLSGFATRPIHVFGGWGLALGGAGSVILAVLGFERMFLGVPLADRPIVLLALLLVVTGVQLLTMGLLGEMLARTYHESQGKPVYRIARVLDHADAALRSPVRQQG